MMWVWVAPNWCQAVLVSVREQLQQQDNPASHPGEAQNVEDTLQMPEWEGWGGVAPSWSTPGTVTQVELDPLHVFNLKRKRKTQ